VEVSLDERHAEVVSAHRQLDFDSMSARSVVRTISRVEATPLWTQLAMAHWWRPAEVGVAEVVAENGATSASIDGAPSLPLPIQVLLPIGTHRLLAERHGRERRIDFEVHVGEPRRVVVAEPEEQTAAVARATDTPGVLLQRARELRRTRGSAAALVAYEALRRAHPRSHEARTVLVTMGQLELELGHPARALVHFDRYLEAGGTLAPEALAGKIAALRTLGRVAGERQAIDRYLSRYPQGFLAPKLRERLNSLR
jgi:hypothetical protein